VFGRDDFEEILKYGGERVRADYAHFYPDKLLASARVSDHVKALLREVFPAASQCTPMVRKRTLHGAGIVLLPETLISSVGILV
jgi:hypothetical protein